MRVTLFGLGFYIATLVLGCSAPTRTVKVAAPLPAAEPAQMRAPGEIRITRIAHASVLIEAGEERILTDPWFSETGAYRPGEPVGMQVEDLPKLTAVMASHGHYDHFDIDTFKAYPHKDVPLIVAPGMAESAREAGFQNVRELAPWNAVQLGNLKVTAAPGKHGVTEVTYVLEVGGSTIYFGGDSLLIPEMDEIPRRFPRINLALLSVNGLKAMGSQKVMNAEEAAMLAGKLNADVAVPMHYRFRGNWFTETFILSHPGTAEDFAAAARKHAPRTAVRILEPGQPLVIRGGLAE